MASVEGAGVGGRVARPGAWRNGTSGLVPRRWDPAGEVFDRGPRSPFGAHRAGEAARIRVAGNRPHRPHRVFVLVAALALGVPLLAPAVSTTPVATGGGVEPDSLPAVGRPLLREVTGAVGLGAWRHGGYLGSGNQTQSSSYFTEFTGPGACWLDAEGDGDLDLYLVSGVHQTHPWKNEVFDVHSALFRNLGDGTFVDASLATGTWLRGTHQGCTAADYDNDGRTDLHVTGWGGSVLFRNLGGTFADVTEAAGVRDAQCGAFACWASSASWLDYDRDGCADLFVDHFTDYDPADPEPFNGPGPGQVNRLFRNRCDGTFEDRTLAANLTHEKSDSWSSVSADFNADGWPDLYVSNDGDLSNMYLNRGDGTFAWAMNGAMNPLSGMGTAVADADHDGDLDIVVTNYVGQLNGVFFDNGPDYDNRGGEPPFDDALPWSGWAAHWYDLNNDANLDLVIANGMTEDTGLLEMPQPLLGYEGLDGQGAFGNLRGLLGPDFEGDFVGRGGAWADYDSDGDVDFLLAEAGEAPTHLFRSEGTGGTFLSVDLVGTAPGVTRDALGAVVRATPAGLPPQLATRTAGTGFLSGSDPRLHFGLRYAETADVEVRWPDGSTQTWTGLRANTFVRLTQGQAAAEVLRALPLVRIAGPAEGQRLAPLAFTATAALGDGAGLARVQWDFGGQAQAEGATASHAFDDVGAFTVRATVTDTLGRTATQAVKVVVRDTLTASIAGAKDRFLPVEQVQGHVAVRFSNGDPVAGAKVRLELRSSTGDPAVDAVIAGLPRAVRETLGQYRFTVEATTGADGRAAFTMPWTFEAPNERVPLKLTHPGAYLASATGGARGSTFDAAHGTLIVLAALPPTGP